MSMTKKFYLFALQLQVTLLHVQSTHYVLVSLSYPLLAPRKSFDILALYKSDYYYYYYYPHHVIATSQPKPRSTLTNQLFLQHN